MWRPRSFSPVLAGSALAPVCPSVLSPLLWLCLSICAVSAAVALSVCAVSGAVALSVRLCRLCCRGSVVSLHLGAVHLSSELALLLHRVAHSGAFLSPDKPWSRRAVSAWGPPQRAGRGAAGWSLCRRAGRAHVVRTGSRPPASDAACPPSPTSVARLL